MALLPGTNSHLIHEPLPKFQKLNTCIGKAVGYLHTHTTTAAVLFITETHERDSMRTWEKTRPNGSRKGPQPEP